MAQQYHSGPFVELLSTQGANPMANWKVVGLKKDSVQKVYDKVVKGNVYVITASGGVSKLQLPREEHAASLGVAQPYLVVQVCIDRGQPLLVECGVCDAGGTKRRITVTTSVSDVKVGPVHSQVPFPASVPREAWINVVVPLADLVPLLFRGCEFRWLDAVSVHLGGGKLRKVFTLRELPGDGGAEQLLFGGALPLPRGLDFPIGVTVVTHFVGAGTLFAAGSADHPNTHINGHTSNGRTALAGSSDGGGGVQLGVTGCGLSQSIEVDDSASTTEGRITRLGGSSLVSAAALASAAAAATGRSASSSSSSSSRLGRSATVGGSSNATTATPAASDDMWQPATSDPTGKGRPRPRRPAQPSGGTLSAALLLGTVSSDASGPELEYRGSAGGAETAASSAAGVGRRAVSAQLPPRLGMPMTPQDDLLGAALGSPSQAGPGHPPMWPYPSQRAQSGPACVSSEHLAGGLGDMLSLLSGGGDGSAPNSPSQAPRHGRRASRFTPGPMTIEEQDPGSSDERINLRSDAKSLLAAAGLDTRDANSANGIYTPVAAPSSPAVGHHSNHFASTSRRSSPLRPRPGAATAASPASRPMAVPPAHQPHQQAALLSSEGLGASSPGGGNGGGVLAAAAVSGRLMHFGRSESLGSGPSRDGRDRDLLSLLQVKAGLECTPDGVGSGTFSSPVTSSISSGLMSPARDRYASCFAGSSGLDGQKDDGYAFDGRSYHSETLPSAAGAPHRSGSSAGGAPGLTRVTASPMSSRKRAPSPLRTASRAPEELLTAASLLRTANPYASPSAALGQAGHDIEHRTLTSQRVASTGGGTAATSYGGGGAPLSPPPGTSAPLGIPGHLAMLKVRTAGSTLERSPSFGAGSAGPASASGSPLASATANGRITSSSPGGSRSGAPLVASGHPTSGRQYNAASPSGSPMAGRRATVGPFGVAGGGGGAGGGGSGSHPNSPGLPPRDIARSTPGSSRLAAAAAAEEERLLSPTRQGRPDSKVSTPLRSQPNGVRRESPTPQQQRFVSPARAAIRVNAASPSRPSVPPAATAGVARDRDAMAAPSASGGVSAAAAAGRVSARGLPAAGGVKASLRSSARSRVSEVDLEEVLAMNGWDGFGVDEEEDMPGEQQLRDGDALHRPPVSPPVGAVRRSTIVPRTEPALAGASSSPPRYASPPFRRNLSTSIRTSQQLPLAGPIPSSSVELDPGVLQGALAAELSGRHHVGAIPGGGGGAAAPNILAAMLSPFARQSFAQRPEDMAPSVPQSAAAAAATEAGVRHLQQARASGTLPIDILLQGDHGESRPRHTHDPVLFDDGVDAWGDDMATLVMTSAEFREQQRLYTPPIVVPSCLMSGGGAQQPQAAGTAQLLQVDSLQRSVRPAHVTDPMLELLYDPMLNCYYDQGTAAYYELKV